MIKNGKLFGKINVIDFLVILVILVAIAAVALFIFMPKSGTDTLIMKFRIEEVDEFVAEKVHIGDELYDDTYSLDMGFVTDIELGSSISYASTSEGASVLTSREGYYSMIITGEVKGTKTKLGAEIGGKKYGVGHTFVLRAGDAKLYLRVYDIKLKEDVENTTATDDEKPTTKALISLYCNETHDFIANALKENTVAENAGRKSVIGTIKSFVITDSKSFTETTSGFVLSPKEGFNALDIVCEAQGIINEYGIVVDEKQYSIGDTFTLRAGNVKLPVTVSGIQAVTE